MWMHYVHSSSLMAHRDSKDANLKKEEVRLVSSPSSLSLFPAEKRKSPEIQALVTVMASSCLLNSHYISTNSL